MTVDIYYVSEKLSQWGAPAVQAIDRRARHAALLIDSPELGLLRVELER